MYSRKLNKLLEIYIYLNKCAKHVKHPSAAAIISLVETYLFMTIFEVRAIVQRKIPKFSRGTWVRLWNLRFAESDE